ncbi:MAG: marine proteobacterial sortase target protein [Burkholderiaceae bacterium]|nr:marine proteobacterial sortase target protein [Burkholderiaceae bacterium]
MPPSRSATAPHDAAAHFDWREWLAFAGGVIATALFVSLVLGALVLLVSTQANAQPPAAHAGVAQRDAAPDAAVTGGGPATRADGAADAPLQRLPAVASVGGADRATLLFRTTHGLKAAPLQHSDVHIEITGPVARTTIVQQFENPGQSWLEGVYVFPLPDDSAVDRLQMRVGERVVEGRIRERAAARAEYREAAAAGRGASLVEQQRPNLFTARVANIAPGARIAIRIEYQQAIAMKDGSWRLRLPTVVGPRYDPANEIVGPGTLPVLLAASAAGAAAGPGSALVRTSRTAVQAGSATRTTDRAPASRPANALTLGVRLDAGVPVAPPTSATHAIRVTSPAPHLHEIALDAAAVADRDFELEWSPRPGSTPAGAFRLERHGELHYGQLVLAPPLDTGPAGAQIARETTFVIDTSGSMAGDSFRQAVRALRHGIAQLRPGDRFNLIRFSSRHDSLYAVPQPFDERRRAEALAWIDALRADGGTEMRGAIEQALAAPPVPGLVSQVVFMTDGAVGYEAEMLALIERRLGARRFFTVGIGSAPNGWFMRKAAEAGRGTYTYIDRVDDVERRMSELYAKLARPMLTHLQLRFDGAQPLDAVALPGELYSGEPIVVRARFAAPPTAVAVSGEAAGIRWESRVPASSTEGSGLHAAWARERIEALGDELARSGADRSEAEALRARIRDLGLAHHLITAYTSLVAVDVTPLRPADAPLHGAAVPTHLPAGWELESVFGQGELAQGATPATLHIVTGLLLLALALLPRLRARLSGRGARLSDSRARLRGLRIRAAGRRRSCTAV